MMTAVLTVMMYFMMDMLARNDSIGNGNVTTVLTITIPVMTLFSFIFLFYTNSFLIKRRKKEIAVYNILGMGKNHIGRMLTIETLIIWGVSLVLGILGGVIFGKLMHLLLLRILQYDVGIRFVISSDSLFYTVILFTAIFFLNWLYNLFQVRLAKPVELLRGGNVGEKEPKTKWLLALIGVGTMGAGYYMALSTERPIEAVNTFLLQAESFHISVRYDLSDEAECGGPCQYLYPEHDRACADLKHCKLVRRNGRHTGLSFPI